MAIPGGTEMDQQQQELEQVLNSLEEAIGKAFENVLYFHTQRGKLYAKLTKRKLYDIAKTLVQFDLSQVTNSKSTLNDLQNQLIVSFDAASKGFESIKLKNAGAKQLDAQGMQ